MCIFHFAPPQEEQLPKIRSVKEFVDGISVVDFFKNERMKAGKANVKED
jgi:hypothetical protein